MVRFHYFNCLIISLIKSYSDKNYRVPAKRDVAEISHKAINLFGSWNEAVLASGLNPNRSHDNRMYRRSLGKALDGHNCDSASEILIDNWLSQNKIAHKRNVKYPNTNHIADWQIGSAVFVEYFGLAKDSPRYDRVIKEKISLCRKNNIKLVAIYPSDLYPKITLENKLSGL